MKKSQRIPYYRSFFKNNTGDFLLGLGAAVTESACMVAVAWLIQQLMDACTGSPEALEFSKLLLISAGLLILYLGALELDRVSTSRFIPRAMAQYKSFLFERLSGKSIGAFGKENTAER